VFEPQLNKDWVRKRMLAVVVEIGGNATLTSLLEQPRGTIKPS